MTIILWEGLIHTRNSTQVCTHIERKRGKQPVEMPIETLIRAWSNHLSYLDCMLVLALLLSVALLGFST